MIDKKKLLKSFIIIALIIIILIVAIRIRNTLARYETVATTERDVDVAFWIADNSFKSQRLLIEDIFPRTDPFEYSFTVSNFEGSKIAETDMEYEVLITTTTNLPLNYTITRNGSTYSTTQELVTDDDGTVYRKIYVGTEENPFIINTIDDTTSEKSQITDTFVLKVTFPANYNANEQYADLMEDVKIDLTARQRIEE